MRYISVLFIFFFPDNAGAQNSPVLRSMKRKSAHVLKIKIVGGLGNSGISGPVLVEVMEVYKSSSIKKGDRIAIKMQPFAMGDNVNVNQLIPGNELVIFLSKEKPSTSEDGKHLFENLYNDFSGWMYYNDELPEFLGKNKHIH